MIEQLCNKYLKLSDYEIELLKNIESTMQYTSNLVGSDLFIDCLDESKKRAIVVAEAKPSENHSIYEMSVVGQNVYPENEPAVFTVFSTGMPVRDIRAITQENKMVKQDVIPVKNQMDEVFAVLISEKDVSNSFIREKKYEKLVQTSESLNEMLYKYDVNKAPYIPSMDENKLAMKEIHHRVKNNLQMIASILNIQSRRSTHSETKKVLKETTNRILSISSIHEILTQNGLEEQISVQKIIQKIINNIKMLLKDNDKNIEILVEGDDLFVTSNKGTSIAIVVNELISNAAEHAFVERTEGKIVVNINRGNQFSSITVSDNGTGIEIDKENISNIGLDLVKLTVYNKLQGKIEFVTNDTGSKIKFDFNN